MSAALYLIECAGILAATVAARFLLARFIPQPDQTNEGDTQP